MAREYVKSWFSMFTDEDFAQQPYSDKWFYQVLLGQPALNYAGVQPMNMRRWRRAMRSEVGVPGEAALEQMLIRMERRGYVFTDDVTGEVLIRSFMRVDQVYRQPNTFKSALRALAHIESHKLAAVMLGELDRMPVPETKSDKLSAEIDELFAAARTHLEGLAEGITEPFAEPFADPFAEGIPEPFAEGIARPGKTDPFPEGITEGIPEGSVGVEVGVISPSEVLTLGSSRARAREADTVETQPEPSTIEPPNGDPEPPTRCKAHADDPDHTAPCGPCANFRKAHERWTERENRRRAQARSAEARTVAQLRAAEIDACDLCDERGYQGNRVCDHDPDTAARAARGMALVRQQLASKGTPS
ncbi:hypothetical protein [Gordonia rubripertincta]|uniref:hypothetical protein n=1 Tax=Gordonia rubripertincta TaxID=36822 RepID=UPI001FD05FFF|nr:hypothetical protein [Gordonia rubripertincta]